MRVSVANNGLERRVSVEVPEDRIVAEVESRLRQMSKSARIDGFRPGKAPMRVVARRFGAAVREEVVGEVLRSTFVEAMDQEQLRPAGEPMIDPVQDTPGEGLSYTATFEVFPDVTLSPIGELNIERVRCEITDADIDKMVETIRQQNQTFEDAGEPAAEGHRLTVDFVGKIDDEPFEGGTAEGVDIEIGSGRMIPGFEEGLIGAAAGESRRIDVTFPEDYHAEALAGKPAVFEVSVQAVKKSVLPELNAEFFERFGVEDGELASFRQKVREQMERERDRQVADRFRNETLKRLGEANPIEVPQSLVARDAAAMAQQMRQNMMMQGMPPEQAETITPEGFQEDAERRVRLGLVLSEIVKREQISVEPETLRAEVEQLATNYEDPQAVINWYFEDRSRLQEIEMRCLEQKVVDWVAGQATVKDVELAFDALMNPGQTAGDAKEGA